MHGEGAGVSPAGSIGPSRLVSRVTEVTCSPPSSVRASRVKLTLPGLWPPAWAAEPAAPSRWRHRRHRPGRCGE
ncbi:hypothetical protein NKG94_15990 [Micromonospora sp. M12]